MSQSNKKNKVNIKIGKKIRDYRTKAGLTQDELSELVGITQKHLSRIESGYHNSHFVTIMAIANALNVPIDAFAEDIDNGANTSLINTIIAKTSDLNHSQLKMLHDIIDIIKNYNIT